MSSHVSARFAGIYKVLNPPDNQEKPEALEVLDDLEGEQQTMFQTTQEQDSEDIHMSDVQESLLQASKGVSESTDSGYQR